MSSEAFYFGKSPDENGIYLEHIGQDFESPSYRVNSREVDAITRVLGCITPFWRANDPSENCFCRSARLMVKNMDFIIRHVEDFTSGKVHDFKRLHIEGGRATWKVGVGDSDDDLPFEVAIEDINGDLELVGFDLLQTPLLVLTSNSPLLSDGYNRFDHSIDRRKFLELLKLARRNVILLAQRLDAFGKIHGTFVWECEDWGWMQELGPSLNTSNLESDIPEDKVA